MADHECLPLEKIIMLHFAKINFCNVWDIILTTRKKLHGKYLTCKFNQARGILQYPLGSIFFVSEDGDYERPYLG